MSRSDLERMQSNLARLQADDEQNDEAKRLLETADEALDAKDQVAADAALASALALPRIDLGTQDCAGHAAVHLICDELDRQVELAWSDEVGPESLDLVVDRAVAVIAAFDGVDDRDVRGAFAYLTDMVLSDDGEARLQAVTADVRQRSALADAKDDDQRKRAVLRLLRARDLLRASARGDADRPTEH